MHEAEIDQLTATIKASQAQSNIVHNTALNQLDTHRQNMTARREAYEQKQADELSKAMSVAGDVPAKLLAMLTPPGPPMMEQPVKLHGGSTPEEALGIVKAG